MKIVQKEIVLDPKASGYHLITDEIEKKIPEINNFTTGTINLLLLHTSAGLTINENADPTVRMDFHTFFGKLVSENEIPYRHISEGLDDMTSHIKSSLVGVSLTIPIANQQLMLGTWQGIYLCEFRNSSRCRRIFTTIIGELFE